MSAENKSPWNSLEVAKLCVSAAVAVSVVLAGKYVADNSAKQASLVATRSKLWETIGPATNDIYTYIVRIGRFNERSYEDIIRSKRKSDLKYFSYRPFFSKIFDEVYSDFMQESFCTWQRQEGARIRTSVERRKLVSRADDFTGEDNRESVKQAYDRLLAITANELDVAGAERVSSRLPKGHRERSTQCAKSS